MKFVIIASLCTFFVGFADSLSYLFFYYAYAFDVSPYGAQISLVDNSTYLLQILSGIVGIFLYSRVDHKRVIQVCLGALIVVHLAALIIPSLPFFIAVFSLIQFFANLLYIFAVIAVVKHLRRDTNRFKARLLGALLPLVVMYQVGDLVSDVLRTILTSMTLNSFMVDIGWRLIFAVPSAVALALLIAMFIVKWECADEAPDTLGRLGLGGHLRVNAHNNYRQALVASLIIIVLMNFQGQNLIVNILPTLLRESSWTDTTSNYYSIISGVLALISVLIAYVLLKRFSGKEVLVGASALVLLQMIFACFVVQTGALDSWMNGVLYFVTVVLMWILSIASNLSVWIIPLVIVLRYTQNARLGFVVSLTVIADSLSMITSSQTGIAYAVLPTTIGAAIVFLIAYFIMPSKIDEQHLFDEGISPVSGRDFGDSASSEHDLKKNQQEGQSTQKEAQEVQNAT